MPDGIGQRITDRLLLARRFSSNPQTGNAQQCRRLDATHGGASQPRERPLCGRKSCQLQAQQPRPSAATRTCRLPPSIIGRSANRTSTPASSRRERKATERATPWPPPATLVAPALRPTPCPVRSERASYRRSGNSNGLALRFDSQPALALLAG
jgi:hypothetical protein